MISIPVLRQKLGITMIELADLCDVDERTVYRWQNFPEEMSGPGLVILQWLAYREDGALATLRVLRSARQEARYMALVKIGLSQSG